MRNIYAYIEKWEKNTLKSFSEQFTYQNMKCFLRLRKTLKLYTQRKTAQQTGMKAENLDVCKHHFTFSNLVFSF